MKKDYVQPFIKMCVFIDRASVLTLSNYLGDGDYGNEWGFEFKL